MTQTADITDGALQTQPEPRVRDGTVPSQIAIPFEGVGGQVVLLYTFFEKSEIVDALPASNYFSVSIGREKIDPKSKEVLQATAEAFIAELVTKAPISMQLVKKMLNNSSYNDLAAQLQQELDGVFMCTTTQDWQEGVDAFAEKRSPQFRGC